VNTEVIEELSDECGSSNYNDDSYLLYEPFQDFSNLRKKKPVKTKPKSPKKAFTYAQVKPSLAKLLKEVWDEEFIGMLAEFFTTTDLIVIFRPLSKFSNVALLKYLPLRLQQEAEFINAYLEENDHLN